MRGAGTGWEQLSLRCGAAVASASAAAVGARGPGPLAAVRAAAAAAAAQQAAPQGKAAAADGAGAAAARVPAAARAAAGGGVGRRGGTRTLRVLRRPLGKVFAALLGGHRHREPGRKSAFHMGALFLSNTGLLRFDFVST